MNFLTINGAKYIYQTGLTVSTLITYLGFNKQVIVVDYNGFILEKALWDKISLKSNDSLEILSIAGGG